jgi:hypothetical protein
MRLIPIIHSKLTDCSLTTSTKYLQADLDLHWIRWLTAVPEQSWHTKLAASPGRLALTHIEFPQPKAPASFCFAFIPFRHRCKRPPDSNRLHGRTFGWVTTCAFLVPPPTHSVLLLMKFRWVVRQLFQPGNGVELDPAELTKVCSPFVHCLSYRHTHQSQAQSQHREAEEELATSKPAWVTRWKPVWENKTKKP